MLRKLVALDRPKSVLLGAGLWWVLAARAAVWSSAGSLPSKLRALDALCAGLPRVGPCTLDEAAWAVTAAARRVPGMRCLAWSLALRSLLRQAGIAAELRIGVATEPSGAFVAHAWVECSGRALSWNEPVEGYSVLRPIKVAS